MATQHPPLQESVPVKNTLQRTFDTLILCLLLSLLAYRLSSLGSHDSVWLVAFLAECWFTFIWGLYMNAKWNPLLFKTYPDHLSQKFDKFDDLPAIDMFVTTADAQMEPPIITVNTVLSLMAAEYPAHKLACYVSDDGCSPITFYALSEAAKFAKLWIPFCKRYNVGVRAPFVFFSTTPETVSSSEEFIHECKHLQSEYEDLTRRVEEFDPKDHTSQEAAEFCNIQRGNHGTIIKVLRENKDMIGGIPHLVYVAREKRPRHPHHYKAGAMNVLTRVSGVMSNAPFILNVDCDMFANNSNVLLHGMCLLLGFDKEVYSGYVQTMQQFYDTLKDDPFGNQLVVLNQKVGLGIGGIQGPFYGGTGCFHRRKVIYGLPPMIEDGVNDELSNTELKRIYGNHTELICSTFYIMSGKAGDVLQFTDLSSRVDVAKKASTSNYELNTSWGKEVGWVYGSTTEDVLTGLRIQAKGWRSVLLVVDPPAFLGSAPIGGPDSLTQYKRWATGLLEIMIGNNSPILATLNGQLLLRQCLAYLVINTWALCSIVEFCYALIPAYCLLANTSFLPKVPDPGITIPVALFIIFNIANLTEYLQCGLSPRAWWNNQRMQRISSLTSGLFGLLSVILKIVGLSETVFEVTRKNQNSSGNDEGNDPGRFTFDSSPMFVPATAIVLLHMFALAAGLLRVVGGGEMKARLGELLCSGWFLLTFWPFVRGLFSKGSYGIPWSVVLKASVLVTLFLHLCRLNLVSSE